VPSAMTAHNKDVFSLRDTVVGEYKRFATSFTTIHAEDIRQQVEAIYARDRYWPEPLIQINPNYKRTTSVDKLVASSQLDARCADIFRSQGESLSLYKHQEQAIALASEGESYVVTRAKIEACADPAVLTRWIARAMTAATPAALFAPDPEPPERP
jgi:hypothetical protein